MYRVFPDLAPARRRFVVGVLLFAVTACLFVAFAMWQGTRSDVTPVAQDQPGPLLLVPGYGGSTTALDVLATTLREHGRDVTVVQLPGAGTGDLREQMHLLDAVAREAARRTGSQSVDVIGYSAGGVVARLWVREHDGDSLARRVVTLGTPNHGTSIADFAAGIGSETCPLACQQLVPDSDVLRVLNAGDETPTGPVFVSVWSHTDQVVTPPESARLEGALDVPVQAVCPGAHVPHSELPSDPQVQRILLAQLGVAAPAVPDRCGTVSADS